MANRDGPLSKPIGTLKIVHNNLFLVDEFEKPVWHTNVSGGGSRRNQRQMGELLDNGNLVLKDSKKKMWQSFDFPTDTLVSEMKLGRDSKTAMNRTLLSRKSQGDPSTGDFTYGVEVGGHLVQSFIRRKGKAVFTSAPWSTNSDDVGNGTSYVNFTITATKEEASYTYTITDPSFFSVLQLSEYGQLKQTTWRKSRGRWEILKQHQLPRDSCDNYSNCGPNGICNNRALPYCHCIKGFKPQNQESWDWKDNRLGCVRKTQSNSPEDGFEQVKRVKLPDTSNSTVHTGLNSKECKKKCLGNNNCTAFAFKDLPNIGCIIWVGQLMDLRTFIYSGEDLFVRLPYADLGKEDKNIMSTTVIIVLICTGVIILPSLMALCYYFCKQRTKESSPASPMGVLLSNPTPPMELDRVVLATENFSTSNIIGRGGFGIIYKGTLLDGQVIAVKRLLKRSAHGMDGIKNELDLLVQLQHINLVRLLGYCFEGNEVLLVYEHLENSSLDTHIFDKTRSCYLNWDMRLQIAKGIARGLLYLHQDSRSRIIHRDLKPSNVLLDKDMVPKISDFGLATLFGRDETEANTGEIVGTYGYMSPEYVADGTYSTGSDVFSFGVLYLEILSGKRNRDFFNNDETLINYIWRNWWAGNGLGVVDPVILNSSDFRPNQVLRCIQIGLLCVQDYPEARPAMSSVIIMLESETIEINEPSQPGYFFRSDQSVASSSSWTVNEITQSIIEAR